MTPCAGQTLTPAEAFAFLLGEWRLTREIPGRAVAEGVLTVTETADGRAEYSEQVTVRTAEGATFRGSQRYLTKRTETGFVLCFADTGSIFEEGHFLCGAGGTLRAEATHLCGQDRYDSVYVLGPGRQFTIRHVVCGPRKRYVSDTVFSAAE